LEAHTRSELILKLDIKLPEEQVMQTDTTSSAAAQTHAGSVVALWRYPVKSMMGEELNSSEVTDRRGGGAAADVGWPLR
jgi:hypothetical protein